jgi:cytochrome o ubiquinol oxidase operon protein cyoD
MTLQKYLTGFILSLILTTAAYVMVVQHAFPTNVLLVGIIALAALQFIVQMIFFLHIGSEKSSRDRLVVLVFATLIIVILVSGSLWIMASLNSRMMPTPQAMELYMNNQTGI